jgi:HlyD family secretion protein
VKQPIRILTLVALVAACNKPEPAPVYEAVTIGKRDIIVTAEAVGAINPDTIVEVKSRASGEIIELAVETGQVVRRGDLLARVDRRVPTNRVSQAQAAADVAQARLRNAEAQLRRAQELFAARAITEQELESSTLDVANSKAAVTSATIDLENAKIALDDTEVRAPMNGTIISKNVERGAVISSPTNDVGGGTVLLKMADLNLVQVKTNIDETDIGKISVGLKTAVTIDAYPTRTFQGSILKIEPQADTIQNVTVFPVLVRIDNKDGMLRPGMSASVKISVGERLDVVAVPNAALRTERDVASAAGVLGIAEGDLATMMEAAKAASAPPAGTPSPDGGQALQGKTPDTTAPSGNAMPARTGMPAGAPNAGGRGGGGRGGGGRGGYSASGQYVVFVLRDGKPTPVYVRTGLTDLDYTEVKSGVVDGDQVLILPSASLLEAQKALQERMGQRSGGLPGQSNTKTGGS